MVFHGRMIVKEKTSSKSKPAERFFTTQADPPQERREGKCRPATFRM